MIYRLVYTILLISTCFNITCQSCIEDNLEHYTFTDIVAIFDNSGCDACHTNNSNTWSYDSYDDLMQTNSCSNQLIIHGNAGQSELLKILNHNTYCNYVFHINDHTLLADDIKKIESWINFGAPENCIPKESDIKDILSNASCNNCHNGDATTGGFNIQDLSKDKLSQLDCGPDKHIHLYNPQLSSLYQIASNNNDCQKSSNYHNPLSNQEIIKIRDWIAAGAPINHSSLPLDLLDFYIYVHSDIPELIWKTSSEIGIDKFVIERSESSGDFIPIGEIKSKGNVQINHYNFKDQTAKVGDYYYRIKIIEFDGRHEYSPVEFVRLSSNNFVFTAYPNPNFSGQNLIIEWFSKNDIQSSAKMVLTDSGGKVIKEFKINDGTTKLQLPNLPVGVYYLTVLDYYGGTHFERLVIVK